ncbi:MAG TPA: S53 family peptidase [Candidatus Acidoferrum sp.]|nr:S53 family peptidase [Candidatus Acidoferrum sp.]
MVPRKTKDILRAILLVLAIVALASLASYSHSVSAQSSSGPNGNAYGYYVRNNTPGFLKFAADQGPADPTTMIGVTVWLKLQNENRIDQMVQDLYNSKSPNFHKWLNQSQFNASFSPTAQQVNAVQNFLTAHGLSVIDVAENNFYVKVQGSIGQVEQAFHISIHDFSFNGATYRSNTSDPGGNDAAMGLIAAVTGMDDLGYEPAYAFPAEGDPINGQMIPLAASPDGKFFESQCFTGVQTVTFPNNATPSTVPQATYTGSVYGAPITNNQLGHLPSCGYSPREVQTGYNMNALYAQGFDGSGQTIVIVDAYGSDTIQQDAEIFSLVYGLPDLTPANFQIVKAPGLVNNPKGPVRNWTIETTLDVEWAHALAPKANIALVTATDRASLDEAVNLAVVRHLGNVISNSWSSIEIFGNPATHDRMNRILQMAAVEGVDVNFATGDFGDETIRIGIKAVDFPASSPFATGIGGTSLGLNPDKTMAFQTGWGTNLTRLANRISTHSSPIIPPLIFGFQDGAGGGTSAEFAKPSFQSGLAGNARLVPDISMLADPQTGAELIETFSGVTEVGVIGGTSLATPLFSAVMAIASQKAGHGLGQAAALVYNLPSGAITDVVPISAPTNVTGTNTTSGGTVSLTTQQLVGPTGSTVYYAPLFQSPASTRWDVLTFGTDSSLTTAVGWDNVTGVGTPNGQAFVNAIAP